ncbi:MAG: electron transfer flavoprotein subunit alpha/FixB family protein [Acidimicrobiales bacterium]|nr:electron transfer flavoprotein subunit alpha/FixB family protein [Acidimicrobiales bacterium]
MPAPDTPAPAAAPSAAPASTLALLVVRDGHLPLGSDEVVARTGAITLLVGDGVERACAELTGVTSAVYGWEAGPFRPDRWVGRLAPFVSGVELVCLPDGPGGRDLAPRLAHELGWPCVPRALAAAAGRALRTDGRSAGIESLHVDGPFVATRQVGRRPLGRPAGAAPVALRRLELAPSAGASPGSIESLGFVDVDVRTMELADAERIVAGGAGLGSAARLERLAAVGGQIGAALGATRVLTDWGWVPHERQIGTTGVTVDPRLYLAFGISGAIQHTAGLGSPDHIVAVNVDPSCPMMAMADLAVVADAPAVIDELAARLGAEMVAEGS